MTELKTHKAASAFPMMDNKRFAELLEDIRQNGQHVPITLCDGEILDGRNRAKACLQLGITPRTEQYSGDPWAFVWSLNGLRRDLLDEQRYLLWKHCNENSEAWQAEKQRIAEEANAKRSAAMVNLPYASTGEQRKEKVLAHNEPVLFNERSLGAIAASKRYCKVISIRTLHTLKDYENWLEDVLSKLSENDYAIVFGNTGLYPCEHATRAARVLYARFGDGVDVQDISEADLYEAFTTTATEEEATH